jgi:uncharacterized membrane protein
LPDTVTRVLGLGAIAGFRSMAAPAALSRAVSNGRIEGLEETPFAILGSPRVTTALRMMAIGEFIVDKLPVTPSRTSPTPLLGRVASGGLVGAALFASEDRRSLVGGALGAAAALAAAYAGERLRLQAAEKLGMPDPVVALLEDCLVVIAGSRLLQ